MTERWTTHEETGRDARAEHDRDHNHEHGLNDRHDDGEPGRTHPYGTTAHDDRSDTEDDRDELHVPSQRSTPESQAEPGDILIASNAATQPAGQHDTQPHVLPEENPDEHTQPSTHSQTPQTPAAQHAAEPFELFDQDPAQLHERWREVQSGFVDEPRDAVERADRLVDEVVTALTTTLGTRTTELRDRWKNTSENDTEQLRLALRDYRTVLERLMALSNRDGR